MAARRNMKHINGGSVNSIIKEMRAQRKWHLKVARRKSMQSVKKAQLAAWRNRGVSAYQSASAAA